MAGRPLLRASLIVAGVSIILGTLDVSTAAPLRAFSAAVSPATASPTRASSAMTPSVITRAAHDGLDATLSALVLMDEAGRAVRVNEALVRDRIVVMNFIFTSCPTICPPMGATFARVAARLDERRVRLVSVSVDPENDTPARLAEWKARFIGEPANGRASNASAWTLLTGAKADIDRLRKTLGVYSADPFSHAPVTVVLDGRGGHTTVSRLNGLVSADIILEAIDALPAKASAPSALPSVMPSLMQAAYTAPQPQPLPQSAAPQSPSTSQRLQEGAGKYFQGLSLIDQNGHPVRLYEDLIAGHAIVIHSFFADCHGSCPVMTGTLVALQARFGDRLGKSLRFVSITVDPENDTPEKLRAYAKGLKAHDGWYFLTGSREAVDAALKKLGQYAATREAHTNVMIVGNEPTGLWKKIHGLSDARAIGDIVQGVLEDESVGGGASR